MKCYTIGISHDGSYEVNPGIEFIKTENPLVGTVVFGEFEVPVDLPEGFEGTSLHNVMIFIEGEKPNLIAGLIVNDVFNYFADADEEIIHEVVLKAITEEVNLPRVLLLIKIVGELENINGLNQIYDWSSILNDKDTYGSVSETGDSYLLSVHTNHFVEDFELAEFNFNITFNEEGIPQIKVTEIDDGTEEE